jgi:hypothetical protein
MRPPAPEANNVYAAGCLYFAVMFSLGFLLGPLRILVMEPLVGPALAVLAEAVPMVAAMYVVAPWAARLGGTPPDAAPRLIMGLVALALLVLAETVAAALLFGRMDWGARLRTTEGLIGYGLMLLYTLMPLLRRRA